MRVQRAERYLSYCRNFSHWISRWITLPIKMALKSKLQHLRSNEVNN